MPKGTTGIPRDCTTLLSTNGLLVSTKSADGCCDDCSSDFSGLGTTRCPSCNHGDWSDSALHPPFRNGGESLDRRHLTGTPIRLTAYPETRGPRRRQKPFGFHRPPTCKMAPTARGNARVGWTLPSTRDEPYHSRSYFANSELRQSWNAGCWRCIRVQLSEKSWRCASRRLAIIADNMHLNWFGKALQRSLTS